ncbi:MAG: hypothetical protein PHS14_13265 [Elusimicrobia bacterium]|nr:hypothetical protein [Elusimicrobiota bacterium]
MNISKLLAAALVATAIGSAAQDSGGANLEPGQKAVTDGNSLKIHPTSPDDIANNKGFMSSFSSSRPVGKPGKDNNGKNNGGNKNSNGGQPGDNNPGDNKPAAPAIKLSGVTGVVQIKTATGVMNVKAGEPIPEIPAGAEIIVVSGDANVSVGGTTIKAGAGDSFTVSPTGAGAVSIAVTGGLVAVVGPDGVSKDVAKGEGVTSSTALSLAPPPAPASVVKTADKKKDAAPDSIPADAPVLQAPPSSSPTQEKAATTCVNTVSPSAPCP